MNSAQTLNVCVKLCPSTYLLTGQFTGCNVYLLVDCEPASHRAASQCLQAWRRREYHLLKFKASVRTRGGTRGAWLLVPDVLLLVPTGIFTTLHHQLQGLQSRVPRGENTL